MNCYLTNLLRKEDVFCEVPNGLGKGIHITYTEGHYRCVNVRVRSEQDIHSAFDRLNNKKDFLSRVNFFAVAKKFSESTPFVCWIR